MYVCVYACLLLPYWGASEVSKTLLADGHSRLMFNRELWYIMYIWHYLRQGILGRFYDRDLHTTLRVV